MPWTDFESATWWMSLGSCQNEPPELFFPKRGTDTYIPKRICSTCPVEAQCLEYALDNNMAFGIWGGKSERERRKLRFKRNQALRAAGLPLPTARRSPINSAVPYRKSS